MGPTPSSFSLRIIYVLSTLKIFPVNDEQQTTTGQGGDDGADPDGLARGGQ